MAESFVNEVSTLNGAMAGVTAPSQDNKPSGQNNVPPIAKLIRSFKTTTAISDGGREYTNKLKEIISSVDKNIEIKELTTPPGTIAVMKGQQCIIMMFAEVLTTGEDTPISSYSKSARATVWALFGNHIKIQNVVIVTPEDYSKVDIMANYLINSFIALLDSEVGKINASMFNEYTIHTSGSSEQYDKFIKMYSPHGVPARADMKLIIYGTKNGSISQNKGFWNESDQDRIDIAAVGAYVTFVAVDGMYRQYIPEIHISEIVSNIPIKTLIPFILGMATSVFMDTNYWKALFHDLGPNQPNIGNLIKQQDGSIFRATNYSEVEWLFSTCIKQPLMVLDIPEGRARVIGIEQYSLPWVPSENTAISSANAFFDTATHGNTIDTNQAPYIPTYYQFDGYIRKGGEVKDSRWIDYLNLMIHHSSTPTKCEMFLQHCILPIDHVKRIKEFGEDMTLLYLTTYSILDFKFIREIQKVINLNMHININNVQAGYISTNNFLNASQGYMGGAVIGSNVGGYQNPFAAAHFWK